MDQTFEHQRFSMRQHHPQRDLTQNANVESAMIQRAQDEAFNISNAFLNVPSAARVKFNWKGPVAGHSKDSATFEEIS